MQDVIFVAILTAFFALAFMFVKACELIIGPDIEATRAESPADSGEQVAA